MRADLQSPLSPRTEPSFENKTLGELLEDPRIAPIAAEAIRCRDLRQESLWNTTLSRIRSDHVFSSDLPCGFARLFQAAETGAWYYPLYSAAECREDPLREGTNIVWFPSEDPAADTRPFILLVPGGGFVNVWNLTEGWPVAERFNRDGYHVFILTYQVGDTEKLLEKNMRDFARALQLIRNRSEFFHVQGSRYITCGFSAGGYLVCLWNTKMGYEAFGLSRPQAVFPVYPVTSLRESIRYGAPDPEDAIWLYGCPLREAVEKDYEIPDHAEGFPPAAIFLAGDDQLVNPENSKLLAGALNRLQIPCLLEIGPEGGHGFGDGTGMCMEGWTERALRWYESLSGS